MTESLLKKDVKDFKILASILLILGGFFILIMVLYIYFSGVNFAKSHNVASYKIGYFDVMNHYELEALKYRVPASGYPDSYFRFYDKNGNDIIPFNHYELFPAYNKMNRVDYTLTIGLSFIMVIIFIIDLIGLVIFYNKRRSPYGFILSFILSVIIIGNHNMIHIKSAFYVLGYFLSAYLVYTAKFIDLNESFIPFVKKRKKVWN